MDEIVVKFKASLEGLEPSSRICLAVSGGVDSMVLLDLASRSWPRAQMVVAHYHHNCRAGASEDQAFVARQADQRHLPFHTATCPEQWEGKADEASLRRYRRKFLKKVAQETRCDWLFTAHHANDQLETLLMRLMRGTGVEGLRSIPRRKGKWVRPMLDLTREQILVYARKQKIRWREDESNQSDRYWRNRVRHELAPIFLGLAARHGSNEKVLRRLQATLDDVHALARLGRSRAKRHYTRHVVQTPFWFRFSAESFELLGSELHQRFFLSYLMKQMGRPPTGREDLLRTLSNVRARKSRFHLPGRMLATYSCGQWFLQTPEHRERLASETSLKELVEVIPRERVTIRLPQPGDRRGSTKLKEIFLRRNIPRLERPLLPLAVDSDGEILWFFPEPSDPNVIQCVDCRFPFSFL